MTIPMVLLALAIYSIGGFIMLRNYNKECIENRQVPFGGKVIKAIIASILCGVITLIILLITLIQIFKEWLGERLSWKQRKEDEKDETEQRNDGTGD